MTPDQSNPFDYSASNANSSSEETQNNPAHQQVLDAHTKYFQDIASVCSSVQQRFQAIQVDYERALERAWQTQDPSGLQTAQNEFVRAFQDACMEANPVRPYEDAYRDYKSTIQKAIANANVDELNFTDIAHISQSLYAVSQMAMMLRMAGTASTGQSPFPREGAASNNAAL